MPRPTIRRTIWTLLVAAIVVLAVVVALPFVASTRLVSDRIAQEMSAWTGYEVELGSRPQIEVWPSFQAILRDVSFRDPEDRNRQVLEADRIEIQMSALAALSGDVSFDRVRLLGAVLRVEPSSRYGYAPHLPGDGRLARAIAAARLAVMADPDAPDTSLLPQDEMGTIEFTDTRIRIVDGASEQDLATSVTGSINWPSLGRGGAMSLQGIWRGESVTLELASTQPLIHMAGGGGALRAALRSAPLTASFDGRAGFSRDGALDGTLQLSAVSVRRALGWLQLDLGPNMTSGALDFSGQLSGTAQRMKFTGASLALNANPGIGGFDIALDGPIPAISGTLAFDVLDLPTLAAVFSPLLPQFGTETAPPTPYIDRMNLDLRLSASSALAGPVTLTEIAATAQVKPGLAVLDISDSTAFGGTFQAGIRAERVEGGPRTVDLKLLATDFDGQSAGDTLGLQKLLPGSRGTLSLTLKGNGSTWERVLGTANGTFSAGFARGSLRAFNLDHFLARLQDGNFFSLDDVSDGTLAMDGVQVRATMERGVARVERATIDTPERSVVLQGIVPYVGGLALSGNVLARAAQPAETAQGSQSTPANNPAPLAGFFVGGSWSAPFITSTSLRAPLP